MTLESLGRQRAFIGLLRHPVVTRWAHADLWPLVYRHRAVLSDWFVNRLGYRMVITDSAARLYRLPAGGEVLAPAPIERPSRRVLVLAILAAAAAEDTEDITSTQELSDRVRVLSRQEDAGLAPYQPDRYAERLLFVKALHLLGDMGALRRMSSTDSGDGWAQQQESVGDVFDVQRELLLQLIDPVSLRTAVDKAFDDGQVPTARYGVLRRLLELPVCLYDDLTEAERTYLVSQRRRLLSWCEEMTGWTAEERAEGIALVATEPDDSDLPFPRLRIVDFTTLMVLDVLLREVGTAVLFDADQLERAADEVAIRYPRAKTLQLEAEGATAAAAVETLSALDLLRSDGPGAYRLTPVAARLRDPAVVETTALLDEGADDE
ncbi:uncharacterized protein (TIGR02678 family) [Kribbella steppae]|uniref:Uncharacterized protein (TIGR02678 family) n=1 Tax=Kribbella steppae TaxID=2512223 RepID=A0A4R2GYI1_9ACTN|nr:TIGR02678 family protein [Kribbella steppae]TCO15656.1 uncharacterized protein (TIGR02678 family) [Kribbella steppae]